VPYLHAQCLRPTSIDGQDRAYPTEQRTTRMLASPADEGPEHRLAAQ
jgi:hypothetical protein